MSNDKWPDGFDFEADETCQQVFKPFIETQLAALAVYDEQRQDIKNGDITYVFHEHAARVAENVRRTCLHMGLGEAVANNMKWALLPHDIGKQTLPVDIWDQEEKPTGDVKQFRRTHTTLGAEIVAKTFPDVTHPFKDLMIDIMLNHHEQMDGNGTHGVAGAALSAPVRLAAIIEAYDGYRIWRPHFGDRDVSPPGVLARMRDEKGPQIYDMTLFEPFAEVKMDDYKHGRMLQDNLRTR